MSKTYKCLTLTLFNTLIGIIFVFYQIKLPIIDSVESEVYVLSFKVKKTISNLFSGNDIEKENFVFVDTSNDIEVVKSYTTEKKEVVVSREELLACLDQLKPYKDSLKLIVCDISLEAIEDTNKKLINTIKYFDKKILFAQNNVIKEPHSIKKASTTVDVVSGKLFTYSLFKENEPTLPLAIHLCLFPEEEITSYKSLVGGFDMPFIKVGNNYKLSELIVEPQINIDDIQPEPMRFDDTTDLKPTMFFELGEYKNYIDSINTHNKIIIIANLSEKGNDFHEDILGKTYGSLFLINAYMGIRDGAGEISFLWMFFMLITLSFFFYESQIHQMDYFKYLKRDSTLYNLKDEVQTILDKLNSFFLNILKKIFRLSEYKIEVFKKSMKIDVFSMIGMVLLLILIAIISFFIFNVQIRFIHCWFIIIFEKYLFKMVYYVNKLYYA